MFIYINTENIVCFFHQIAHIKKLISVLENTWDDQSDFWVNVIAKLVGS